MTTRSLEGESLEQKRDRGSDCLRQDVKHENPFSRKRTGVLAEGPKSMKEGWGGGGGGRRCVCVCVSGGGG